MDNYILKQFGSPALQKDYKFGVVSEVKMNHVYIIKTSAGLKLTIQDLAVTLSEGDPVLLALSEGSTGNSFIIKKGSKSEPAIKNFIIGNNLN